MTTPRVSEPQPGPARDVAAAVAELAGAQSWAELGALLLARADELRAARRAPELAAWIALIPPALRGPRLSLALARCLADQGAYDPAVLALDGSLADPALDPAAARELALCKAGLEQVRGEYASADALVLPYLADPSAPPLDRARALRIHGIGLVFQGADDRALLALEQAAALARAGGPSRLLGLALHDFGNAAARLGRYLLAERTLRLAQEVWTQLGAPPDLASTLGLRALVALNAGRPGEARDLAQSAFDLALSHGRGREIAGALAVQGEIAAAAQDWPAARRCFEQAEVECQRAGVIEGGALCFALAMQSLIARQLADLRRLGELLPLLAAAQPATPLERAWIAAGQAAARMSLGVAGAAEALDEAACLGAGPTLASGMLLILRAQASWLADDPAGARQAWLAADQLLLAGRGGLPALLQPIACWLPALLAAADAWGSPYARRLAGAGSPLGAAPPVAAPLLRLRLLGRIEACWLGHPVLLPRHGAELLALLALAGPAGISGDDLRDRLYGDPAASPHGLRKLLERVRKLMPGVVALDGAAYRLALPAGQLQADLLTVRETPLACQSLEELELAASLAGQPLLPGSEEPWVLGERETLRRRAVELWLALADLARERHAFELAVRAYQEARALSPLHERAVASSLRLNLDLGRHAEAVSVFLEYRSLLDDMLGLNPSPVVELLYKQALGA